ncbi:uncharacterized protein LOC109544018 [Dendroctonus ponderosae]|uniref:uncharacterized protein LOC109544018 n=1 Tax=Dendroctonus ponderosae TaxID=77166 RepID=UPI002034C471|nr:uncharacterized protein LOC109544018 [Dendroctonus ponderosae]
MRLRHSRSIFCFCFFIHVTLAYSKNDSPVKNGQRTNPKKHNPANVENSGVATLRHSSKFPHLDQIRTRIAGLDSDRRFSDRSFNSDARWGFGDSVRLRHHGWSNRARVTTTTTTTTPSPDDDLFNNYGELDGDEMEDDYPDNIFDTSDNGDAEVSFQAEEPSSTKKYPQESQTYSSLTEYKWNQLGTRDRVSQARKLYMEQKDAAAAVKKSSEESKTTAVVEHFIRVRNSGECKKPIPKVIPVHLEHTNPSVTYIPHCTVLHRCAEDTGCCKYDASCQYKERVEVSLYFYVKQIGADVTKVEKLKFYNHTECECRPKTEAQPDDGGSTTERQKRVAERADNAISVPVAGNRIPESLLKKCKCPKEFIPKIKFGSKCYCDCENDNEDCLRMRKGKEYSSLIDRICIQKRDCGIIACDYGPYNKLKGRCPRYDES